MGRAKKSRGVKKGRASSLQSDRVIQQRLRAAIRQVWSRFSQGRKDVLYEAKTTKRKLNKTGEISARPDVFYTCARCSEKFKLPQVQVDHIEPVGTTPKFPPDPEDIGWVTWLLKLFCAKENLQVLCKPCHQIKTNLERKQKGESHVY